MGEKKAIYTIRDLAREFDVTSRTIRFYEEGDLLHPQREGQTRLYTDRDRVKLKLILRGKRLGFSLAESRELIEMYDPTSDNIHQLLALREKILNRREALQQQLLDIQDMQNELDAAEERCLEALRGSDHRNDEAPAPQRLAQAVDQ
ncbi:MerR family transcriptional regulator [Tamilnaduibacter salinus]|uniref:MerR family transcriptional regulator n=1 Tax=Tamilnaduibacter salinus TaxID=1484056 RepID=A0A2A2I3B2_9GAMM|nr:MerR family DNA-binding transcriptional regulator [Tamilnaduibacter salinus]PAV25615.1 MerR family transcriptional regulator [Tamilnaduibacter salinus]PVY78100.1 MerR family transcriptional regulator [Tamilnaduibacter salinus]